MQYVRGNFFAGEHFAGLADAQARAEAWCRDVAGTRIHGTIAARPAEVFAEREAAALLPPPEAPYDVPVFARVKVHRDFHVLTCPMFVTTAEFLPQHHAQRQATLQIISAAEASGHARVAEMNRQVAGTWTRSSPPSSPGGAMMTRQPPVRPDPLSGAAARRHELTRSKAIQALRELDRASTPVTFACIARAAGVSRSWLYTQPDISGQIRRLRQKT